MGSLKTFIADTESLEILKLGTIENNVYKLPELTLDRPQYESVNKILVALGAKWDKKSKGHIFDYDISAELQNVFATGIVTDWKKSTDFFYTPEAVVNEILGLIPEPTQGNFKMLEPSAGQGHILDLFKENFPNAEIICVEQNPMHCERLRQKGYDPINADFMEVKATGSIDAVVMNPPFTYEMEHIQHAYDFLAEDGILITVCSSGILAKSTKKGKEFKQWYDDHNGCDYALPDNSFKESGTNVSTKMLVFQK